MTTVQIVKQQATLTTGHPFGQILAQVPQADVITGDPAAAAAAAVAAGATGALLMAGAQDFDNTQQLAGGTSGLTAAGVAAIASAYNTYVSGLSSTKKAQIGSLRAIVTSAGMAITCHVTDVASLATTLQTALNNTSNFGPVGS